MAFVTDFTCRHCGRQKFEVVHHSGICCDCRAGIAKADEDAHMARLALLSLEERVKKIELDLYRLNAEKRLAALEVHHIKY